MDIELVKAKMRRGEYKTSHHAEVEREAEAITIRLDHITQSGHRVDNHRLYPGSAKWIDARTRAPGRERQND